MYSTAQWRSRLRPASFRGVQFKIESSRRGSGRRLVLHEFPKRDDPYAEDMGRRARRFAVTGYVVGENYMVARDALVLALEQEGPAMLILDRLGEQMVKVDSYGVTEVRERGGIAEFDMTFVEAGTAPDFAPAAATQEAVGAAANEAGAATTEALGNSTAGYSPTFQPPTQNYSMPGTGAQTGAFGFTGPVGAGPNVQNFGDGAASAPFGPQRTF